MEQGKLHRMGKTNGQPNLCKLPPTSGHSIISVTNADELNSTDTV